MYDAARALPVTATFLRAYHLVWYNRRRLARAGAIPFLFLTASNYLYMHMLSGIKPGIDPTAYMAAVPHAQLLFDAIVEGIGGWTLMSVNVSWRRFLLLQATEVEPFYFKGPFWRYFGTIMVTFLGLLLAMALIDTIDKHILALIDTGFRAGHDPVLRITEPLYFIMLAAGVLGLAGVILRYSPYYTRMTMDTPHYTLHEIAASMRGNVLRLVAIIGMTTCTVGFCIKVLLKLLSLIEADPSNTAFLLVSAVATAFLFVTETVLLSAVGGLVYDFVLPEETRRHG